MTSPYQPTGSYSPATLTEPAIATISAYIHDTRGDTEVWKALINALGIVFPNNLFKFSDTTWRQISGTGMGISPAPHGTLVDKVSFYRRFIDDVFGIWLSDPDPATNEAL